MISIITVCYNSEDFIEECINNVVDQLGESVDLEHIIIDGKSKDKTLQIIKKYAKKYNHIRYISEKDKGQSDAMNKGIAMAKGDVLSFLNVDDYYEKNTIKLVNKIKKDMKPPYILIGNCNVVTRNKKTLYKNIPDYSYKQVLQLWKYRIPNNPSSYFYSKELHSKVGNYDIQDNYAMDLGFIIRLFRKANVYYIDKTLGNYRYFSGTKTFDSESSGKSEKHIEYAIKNNSPRYLSKLLMIGYRLDHRLAAAEDIRNKYNYRVVMMKITTKMLSSAIAIYAFLSRLLLVNKKKAYITVKEK